MISGRGSLSLPRVLRAASLALVAFGCRAAASNVVHATVVQVVGSRESIVYQSLTVSFDNPTLKPCALQHYAVTWPGGRVEAEVNGTLPPGISARTLRVSASDGHIDALTSESASVTVFARCGAGSN
ncbi:MAG: hypothetical protein ABJB12_06785 [Pseudomonadota bacterium]